MLSSDDEKVQKYKRTGRGELFLRKFQVVDEPGEKLGAFAVYATDRDLVRMANTVRWFADSTFKVVPRLF